MNPYVPSQPVTSDQTRLRHLSRTRLDLFRRVKDMAERPSTSRYPLKHLSCEVALTLAAHSEEQQIVEGAAPAEDVEMSASASSRPS